MHSSRNILRRFDINVLKFVVKVKLALSKKQFKQDKNEFDEELNKKIAEEEVYHERAIVELQKDIRGETTIKNRFTGFLHSSRNIFSKLISRKKETITKQEIDEETLEKNRKKLRYELLKLDSSYSNKIISELDYLRSKAKIVEKINRIDRIYEERRKLDSFGFELKRKNLIFLKKKDIEKNIAELEKKHDMGIITELFYLKTKAQLVEKLKKIERAQLMTKEKQVTEEEVGEMQGILLRRKHLLSKVDDLEQAFRERKISELSYLKDKAELIEKIKRLNDLRFKHRQEKSLQDERKEKRLLLLKKKQLEYEISKLDKLFKEKALHEIDYLRMKAKLVEKMNQFERREKTIFESRGKLRR